ncbi:transposase-like protein [Paraphaeosphaeria sporulosa]
MPTLGCCQSLRHCSGGLLGNMLLPSPSQELQVSFLITFGRKRSCSWRTWTGDFQVTHKLHCFVEDNAANNGTTFIRQLDDITRETSTSLAIDVCTGPAVPSTSYRNSIYGSGVRNFERSKSHKRQKRTSQLDEYFDSLYDDKVAGSEVLYDPHRWCTDVDQKRYPVVHKMAIDHPAVPTTSCDCERCFSSARKTITCDRNSLSPAVVEALQLQKNWRRRDALSIHLKQLSALVSKKDANARQNIQPVDDSQFHSNVNTSLLPN